MWVCELLCVHMSVWAGVYMCVCVCVCVAVFSHSAIMTLFLVRGDNAVRLRS